MHAHTRTYIHIYKCVYIYIQDEIRRRRDFRNECVLSIDPSTARVSFITNKETPIDLIIIN